MRRQPLRECHDRRAVGPLLPGLLVLAAAALAVFLAGCQGEEKTILPGPVEKVGCPIPHELLGGVWRLEFPGGEVPILTGCADEGLNGQPVGIRSDIACESILPCPAVIEYNTAVALDTDFDRGLIVVGGPGRAPGDYLSAEIRTSGCLTTLEFRQVWANDPLLFDIRCGGDLIETTGTMAAECQRARVYRDGTWAGECSIDPPYLPLVTLRPDDPPLYDFP